MYTPLLHHGAFHVTVEDEVVFVSRDGEAIEPALRPQFPEVPGAFPLMFPREPDCSAESGSFSTLVAQ